MRSLLLGVLILSLVPATLAQQPELTIVHINVSQGDATLLLGPSSPTGDRTAILVDAGDIRTRGADGGRIVHAVLEEYAVDTLDAFIATHYDADHIGGFVTGDTWHFGTSFVLGPDGLLSTTDSALTPDDDIPVLAVIDRGDFDRPSSKTDSLYQVIRSLADHHVALDSQAKVDTFAFDLGGGASMIALAANGFVRDRATPVPNVTTENERSLVFLVSFGGFDYLLGGDATGRASGGEDARVEEALGHYLVDNDIHLDVLHVGHHGADNASDSLFLALARPEVAVISLGNGNSHEHPRLGALERLAAAGLQRIYQTEWGTTEEIIPEEVRARQAIFQNHVVLATDGSTYTLSTRRSFTVDDPEP